MLDQIKYRPIKFYDTTNPAPAGASKTSDTYKKAQKLYALIQAESDPAEREALYKSLSELPITYTKAAEKAITDKAEYYNMVADLLEQGGISKRLQLLLNNAEIIKGTIKTYKPTHQSRAQGFLEYLKQSLLTFGRLKFELRVMTGLALSKAPAERAKEFLKFISYEGIYLKPLKRAGFETLAQIVENENALIKEITELRLQAAPVATLRTFSFLNSYVVNDKVATEILKAQKGITKRRIKNQEFTIEVLGGGLTKVRRYKFIQLVSIALHLKQKPDGTFEELTKEKPCIFSIGTYRQATRSKKGIKYYKPQEEKAEIVDMVRDFSQMRIKFHFSDIATQQEGIYLQGRYTPIKENTEISLMTSTFQENDGYIALTDCVIFDLITQNKMKWYLSIPAEFHDAEVLGEKMGIKRVTEELQAEALFLFQTLYNSVENAFTSKVAHLTYEEIEGQGLYNEMDKREKGKYRNKINDLLLAFAEIAKENPEFVEKYPFLQILIRGKWKDYKLEGRGREVIGIEFDTSGVNYKLLKTAKEKRKK